MLLLIHIYPFCFARIRGVFCVFVGLFCMHEQGSFACITRTVWLCIEGFFAIYRGLFALQVGMGWRLYGCVCRGGEGAWRAHDVTSPAILDSTNTQIRSVCVWVCVGLYVCVCVGGGWARRAHDVTSRVILEQERSLPGKAEILVTAVANSTLLYHTCQNSYTTKDLGVSCETVLIPTTLYVFHWESRFPFEMKEHVVPMGKWNRKSSYLSTDMNKSV